MASSDDESDSFPRIVSNYHFVDEKDEPVSFSILPIQWSEKERPERKQEQVFLHGSADNGLQKIYKQVVAWRFDLSNMNPEISVLSKDNVWIKLQKPRKSFEETIRTVLITVHSLNFAQKNPEASGKSLWDYLSMFFCLYEVRPSLNDLLDHMPLISEAINRDDSLAKSKLLLTLLEEKPVKRKSSDEDLQATKKSRFIVDDSDEDMIDDAEEDEDSSDDVYDSVCAICDNGGELLCCEGSCMRSFHATKEAGSESICVSLGYSPDEVDAIEIFFCKNCEYKQHQCFACGKMGSSDKSSGAEVFRCINATCGHFYHPHCVSKLIHRENEVSAEELGKKIAAGESFTCPIHKCCVCKQGENKKDLKLQFAVCRRCPRAYHRKCLPREIAFEDMEEEEIITRAWEGLLPNRILIYCLDHDVDAEIGTPIRDHIKFPGLEEKKIATENKKFPIDEKKRKRTLVISGSAEKVVSKKKKIVPEDSMLGRNYVKTPKPNEKLDSTVRSSSIKHVEKVLPRSDSSKKMKVGNVPRKPLYHNANLVPVEADQSSLGDRLYTLMTKGSEHVKPGKQITLDSELSKSATKKLSSALPPLDADTEKRLSALIKDAASSISLKDVIKKHKVPSTHSYSLKNVVDKAITVGKLEGSVEAVRTALKKLEEGCSIEDAEAVCEPEILAQIFKWKNKLKVYLSPFLYGMRYTSFGRHFTKLYKLQEIVDKLHWYVQNGDMIVDFCCGANDFSIVMKNKLEETGKNCAFKNYDFIPPKNDFSFEKRDWMTVQPKELPPGSQLIMGLNPPFGVRAALANKFIDKALEFKPKLLILIVPPETEGLDKKKTPYDLIWEDDHFLSGKSFYLPGSVDINDKQMDQWNLRPPLLYLWSRRDWAAKYMAIAEKHDHLPRKQEDSRLDEGGSGTFSPDHLVEDHDRYDGSSRLTDDLPLQTRESEDFRNEVALKEGSVWRDGDREGHESRGYFKDQSSERSSMNSQEKHGRGIGEAEEQNVRPWVSEMQKESAHSSQNIIEGGTSLEDLPSRSFETHHLEVDGIGYQQTLRPSPSGSNMQFGSDDVGRRYRFLGSESPRSDYEARNIDHGPGYRPYMMSEIEEKYTRESEIRSQVRLYGQQDFESPRSSYMAAAHDHPRYSQIGSLSSPYGHHLASPAESFYNTNMSAMQRYAPRLDELNHTRINGLGSNPPMNRDGVPDPRVPRPGFGGIGGPMGFAPGPRQSYSHQNSAGWLNE